MGTHQLHSPQRGRPRRSMRIACAVAAIAGMVLIWLGASRTSLTLVGTGLLLMLVAITASHTARALTRIKSRLRKTSEQLKDIRAALNVPESPVSQFFQTSQDESDARPIELTSLGEADPSLLAAATLSGSGFPRLATLLNEAAVESETDLDQGSDDDLPEAVPNVVPMYDTPDDTEHQLRKEFSQRARRRDYAGMLDVGRRICTLLPDRPIAAEYERLEPVLIRKAATAQSDRKARSVQSSPGPIVFDHSKPENNNVIPRRRAVQ